MSASYSMHARGSLAPPQSPQKPGRTAARRRDRRIHAHMPEIRRKLARRALAARVAAAEAARVARSGSEERGVAS